MDRARFWSLIDLVDDDALDAGDEAAAVEPLLVALAKRDEATITGFADHLAQVLFDLDGQIYADNAGDSGGSGDGFLYARCFVVSRGQKHYTRVVADPTQMPKSVEQWCESLLYVAQRAWATKTGRAEEAWSHETPVSYESFSNKALWP